MGRLGYMTDIPLNEMSTILPGIIQGNYESDERFLLEASVIRNGVISHQGLALNDVVISRSSISGMVELAVDVNHSFMYNQRSDGLIVSTPTGSTRARFSPPFRSGSCASTYLAKFSLMRVSALSNMSLKMGSSVILAS